MNSIDPSPQALVALPRGAHALVRRSRSLALCALLAVALGSGLVACAPEDASAPSATEDADVEAAGDAVAEDAAESADDAESRDDDGAEMDDHADGGDSEDAEDGGESDDGDVEDDSGSMNAAAVPDGLSYDMLTAAIVANEMFPGPVTLVDGHAEEPAAPGSASMITADLHPEAAWGDLDGDGDAEAVTVLYVSGGGSGTFRYLVAFDEIDGQPIQLATALIGDRVQIDELAVLEQRVALEVTTHGPDDPMCCPTMEGSMLYQLTGGELLEVATE